MLETRSNVCIQETVLGVITVILLYFIVSYQYQTDVHPVVEIVGDILYTKELVYRYS